MSKEKDAYQPAESMNLAALHRKRSAVKGLITKISNALMDKDGSQYDQHALRVREEHLRASFNKWEDITLEIAGLYPEAPIVDDNVEKVYH